MPPQTRVSPFKIEIEGIQLDSPVSAILPSVELQVSNTRTDDARNVNYTGHEFTPLILTYKLGKNPGLYNWVEETMSGRGHSKAVHVLFFDGSDTVVHRINYHQCIPSKHTIGRIGSLNRSRETLEIIVNSMDRT